MANLNTAENRVADSGAIYHMTRSPDTMRDLRRTNGKVRVGDSRTIDTVGYLLWSQETGGQVSRCSSRGRTILQSVHVSYTGAGYDSGQRGGACEFPFSMAGSGSREMDLVIMASVA